MYFKQNKSLEKELSYVLGVCDGDGSIWKEKIKTDGRHGKDYVNTYCIELRAKDYEFVKIFMDCFLKSMKRPDKRKPRSIFKIKQGLFRICMRSKSFGDFYFNEDWSEIIKKNPTEYLRGIYDSDGNLSHNGGGRLVVRIFKGDESKIDRVCLCLDLLNIKYTKRIFRKAHSETNICKDTKELFVVQINTNNADNFLRKVVSTIPRKRGG